MEVVSGTPPRRKSKPYLLLCCFVSVLSAGLLVYSQTAAFAWDEGFHLLAAQLIRAGKRPYLDFLFSQTPLNAYWNAMWMSLFGESWRTAHAVAALCISGAVMLMADFVFLRFPDPRWRLAAAILAAALFGMNVAVLEYGTIGQAYGLCLLLISAAFRCSMLAIEKKGLLWPCLAGLCAGAAAASSLLTSALTPVLLLWLIWNSPPGRKITGALSFGIGVTTAFVPLLILFFKAPSVVLFDVVQYNLLYREVHWPGVTQQNIGVFLSWIDSSHALLLALLSLAGLAFIKRSAGWEQRLRRDLYLCAWVALALGMHISSARPTFQRYYLLLVPFLAPLATVGLYWAVSHLHTTQRPFWPVFATVLFIAAGAAKLIHEGQDNFTWKDFDGVSREVAQSVPADAPLYADEHVYFLTHHPPPPGLELHDSHKLDLPPDRARELHLVPMREIERRIRAGEFSAVEGCDEDRIGDIDLHRIYSQKKDAGECFAFFHPIHTN
jgi:hypothetical protein